MDLVRQERGHLMRPLKVLVPLIHEALQAGEAASLEHYRAAGEMLLEAKEQVAHGEWGGWIQRHFHLSGRTARYYMKLAADSQKGTAVPFSSLRAATRSWAAPVRQIAGNLNLERLAQERSNQAKERELVRELARKMVDIGYRVLAAKLHPDKPGGSHEAMQRLNEAKRILKGGM